jgi:large subunit ribosomal protein L9e
VPDSRKCLFSLCQNREPLQDPSQNTGQIRRIRLIVHLTSIIQNPPWSTYPLFPNSGGYDSGYGRPFSLMPRQVLQQDNLKIEDPNVTVTIKAGVVTVEGPLGTLTRDLSHLHIEFEWDSAGSQVTARCWFGNRKQSARIGTLFGHIKNMVVGVTKGYRYKMRFVTAHFPIKHLINDTKDEFSFSHFMGERERRTIRAPPGVKILDGQKEEIVLEGSNLLDVTQTAAKIHQSCHVRNKDLRKFLDGIYISEKTTIKE